MPLVSMHPQIRCFDVAAHHSVKLSHLIHSNDFKETRGINVLHVLPTSAATIPDLPSDLPRVYTLASAPARHD